MFEPFFLHVMLMCYFGLHLDLLFCVLHTLSILCSSVFLPSNTISLLIISKSAFPGQSSPMSYILVFYRFITYGTTFLVVLHSIYVCSKEKNTFLQNLPLFNYTESQSDASLLSWSLKQKAEIQVWHYFSFYSLAASRYQMCEIHLKITYRYFFFCCVSNFSILVWVPKVIVIRK